MTCRLRNHWYATAIAALTLLLADPRSLLGEQPCGTAKTRQTMPVDHALISKLSSSPLRASQPHDPRAAELTTSAAADQVPPEHPLTDPADDQSWATHLVYHSDVEPADRQELRALRLPQMNRRFSVDISTSSNRHPIDYSVDLFEPVPGAQRTRNWDHRVVNWAPSGLYHQPLYFEDAPLERYGQGCGGLVQPVVSGARFFTNLASLPYQIGVHGVHERVYALGYHRPGSPTPPLHQRLPWEADAAALQVGTVLGLVFVLP